MIACRWSSIADFLAEWLVESRLPSAQQAVLDRYYGGYRSHFGSYIRRHYSDQTSEAVRFLQNGSQTVLEVGSGCGTEALWFALNGASVLSIDNSERRVDVARARQRIAEGELGNVLDLEFRKQSFLDLNEEARFDLVWMEQTFHHIEPRLQVYQAIAKALRPGGHVVISEANGWNPFLQTKLFMQRGFRTRIRKTLSDGNIVEYGNERISIPVILKRRFRTVGIEPLSVRYFRTLPNVPWADRFLALETNLAPILPRLLFTHFNFVGKRS